MEHTTTTTTTVRCVYIACKSRRVILFLILPLEIVKGNERQREREREIEKVKEKMRERRDYILHVHVGELTEFRKISLPFSSFASRAKSSVNLSRGW